MKAVIMAGGEGTRLRPLTCDVPKPLVKLCGKPISEYILELLDRHGCEKAVFTLRYLGDKIEDHFESGSFGGITLDFSYEDEPLGTAGCVKKAVSGTDIALEDFIVISGDAMCDFDLTAALAYHKNMGSDATIIVKKVDDPREYGLVIAENGIIKGFSEKPSYTSCVSELANTGIYILSPRILPMIPSGRQWDFARDVFPAMLEKGLKLAAYEDKGYWCDIGDLVTYKSCQSDIISGKADCRFSSTPATKLPKGLTIRGNCRVGRNLRAGTGTIIEAGAVICDNVTLGNDVHIHGSVILDGAFIGDNATINGAVICENAKIECGAGVFEDSVIGAGSIIGRGATIRNGAKVWNGKHVPDKRIVFDDIKHGGKGLYEISESGISGETNADITPAFLTRLGSAAAGTFEGKTLIASEPNLASVVFKAAVCAGFSSAGSTIIDCSSIPLPVMFHLSRILDAQNIIYVSAYSRTDITILSKGGMPLTRVLERKLESAMNRGEYPDAPFNGFGAVKTFRSAKLLYRDWLESAADFHSRYKIRVDCNNSEIKKTAECVFDKVNNKNGTPLTVKLNYSGTRAELIVSEKEKADWTRLIAIACAEQIKSGFDAAVPLEFPSFIEYVAKSLGKNIHRFYRCPNDNSDSKAREIASAEPFLYDGIMLAVTVLKILSRSLMTLDDYVKSFPRFATENRFLHISVPPQKILNKMLGKNNGSGEGVCVGKDDGRVLMRSSMKGDGIFLYAESVSAETAKSLCDNVEKAVKNLMNGNSTERP